MAVNSHLLKLLEKLNCSTVKLSKVKKKYYSIKQSQLCSLVTNISHSHLCNLCRNTVGKIKHNNSLLTGSIKIQVTCCDRNVLLFSPRENAHCPGTLPLC